VEEEDLAQHSSQNKRSYSPHVDIGRIALEKRGSRNLLDCQGERDLRPLVHITSASAAQQVHVADPYTALWTYRRRQKSQKRVTPNMGQSSQVRLVVRFLVFDLFHGEIGAEATTFDPTLLRLFDSLRLGSGMHAIDEASA
jgi:hypothetical protein